MLETDERSRGLRSQKELETVLASTPVGDIEKIWKIWKQCGFEIETNGATSTCMYLPKIENWCTEVLATDSSPVYTITGYLKRDTGDPKSDDKEQKSIARCRWSLTVTSVQLCNQCTDQCTASPCPVHVPEVSVIDQEIFTLREVQFPKPADGPISLRILEDFPPMYGVADGRRIVKVNGVDMGGLQANIIAATDSAAPGSSVQFTLKVPEDAITVCPPMQPNPEYGKLETENLKKWRFVRRYGFLTSKTSEDYYWWEDGGGGLDDVTRTHTRLTGTQNTHAHTHTHTNTHTHTLPHAHTQILTPNMQLPHISALEGEE